MTATAKHHIYRYTISFDAPQDTELTNQTYLMPNFQDFGAGIEEPSHILLHVQLLGHKEQRAIIHASGFAWIFLQDMAQPQHAFLEAHTWEPVPENTVPEALLEEMTRRGHLKPHLPGQWSGSRVKYPQNIPQNMMMVGAVKDSSPAGMDAFTQELLGFGKIIEHEGAPRAKRKRKDRPT